MSDKLRLKDVKKYNHVYVLATSDNGITIRAVCDFTTDKIIYNVHHDNLVEIVSSLSEAVKLYNDLID
jgi:hypothetical protein